MHHSRSEKLADGHSPATLHQKELARRLYRRRRSWWATVIEVAIISMSVAGIWAAATFERGPHAKALFGSREDKALAAATTDQAFLETGSERSIQTDAAASSNDLRPALPAADESSSWAAISQPQPPTDPISAPQTAATGLTTADMDGYLRRARELVRLGDIAAARLMLERAAQAKDPSALVALADTYDPVALRRLRVVRPRPDPERARALYREAVERGGDTAREHLNSLK